MSKITSINASNFFIFEIKNGNSKNPIQWYYKEYR